MVDPPIERAAREAERLGGFAHVAAVAAHPGVGLLMVRSQAHGAVVFGHDGTRFLDEDRVEGDDPTTLFGPHTIMSLKREDAMLHAPDLLLLSQYDPELGEVAAFEELIGSHGGLGGPQTEPFILSPPSLPLPSEPLLGAAAVHGLLLGWRRSLENGGTLTPAETAREPTTTR